MEEFSDFSNVTIHDLLANDRFIGWVRHPTPELDIFWNEVQRTYPGKNNIIKDARKLVIHLHIQEDEPPEGKKMQALNRLRDAMGQTIAGEETVRHTQERNVIAMKIWRVAATVALLVLAGIGGWYYFSYTEQDPFSGSEMSALAADVVKTTLFVGNADPILPDEQPLGTILEEEGLLISKTDSNCLEFLSTGTGSGGGELYASLAVPPGRQYQLTMSDGSRIWLNARSAVRFSAIPSGIERRTGISGEVYFEVEADPDRPFVVHSGDLQVEVLGTRFNVRHYDNSSGAEVTLVAGSVQLKKGDGKPLQLSPGEKASYLPQSDAPEVQRVSADNVVSWINGLLSFHQEPIEAVMQRVSRWYNVEVIYEGRVPSVLFSGTIPLVMALPDVLSILEEAGGVRFVTTGNRLQVYAVD